MMNRYPRTDPWLQIGIWSACLMALIAGLASPADAQTQSAAAAEAKEASASTGDEADDDELLEPSNTGYIDSAIIANRVRIRVDAAFDADSPDRAEFLYGKCECLTRKSGQSGAGSPGPVGGGQPGGDLDYEELRLYLEYAPRERLSLFVEVPYRQLDALAFFPGAFDAELPGAISGGGPDDLIPFSGSGIGDINLGFKYGLVTRPERAVTFQLRGYLPTGDAKEGVGTDHASIEPAVLWFEDLGNRWQFESEAALWLPTDGSSDPVTAGLLADGKVTDVNPATGRQVVPNLGGTNDPVDNSNFAGEVLRLGVGLSRRAAPGKRVSVSPVAELVGWYVMDGFKSVHFARPATETTGGLDVPGRGHFKEANGDTIVNLKLGARIRTSDRGSIYAGYGFALTDQVWYDSIFRLEYRVGFSTPKQRASKQAKARAAADRAAAAEAAAAKRTADEAAAETAAARRAEAEAAAKKAEAAKAAAEAAAREAEAKRAQAEAAARAAEAARAEAEAAQADAARGPTHHVAAAAAPCLNLRPEPSLSEPRLSCLQPGAPVTLLEPGDEWSRIRTRHGMEGWSVSRGLEAIP